jgi:hypothetical protein
MRKQTQAHLQRRRSLPGLFPLFAALLLVMPLRPHAADQRLTHTTIRVAAHGWGDTPIPDLQVVLESVAQEFGQHFPNRPLNNIEVLPGQSGPLVLYERAPDGAHVVKLSARDGRWFQFVYQFAHELCHVYSNFDNKRDASGQIATMNQWFEESVCEAASLFVLRSLASTWSAAPPDSSLAQHAADLRAYSEYFLEESHRRLPATQTLALWFRENQHDLANNPYHRSKNEVVANVLLPYFEKNPDNWEAIAYLNQDAARANLIFERYLVEWMEACPEKLKEIIAQLIAAFENSPSPNLQADDRRTEPAQLVDASARSLSNRGGR